MLKIKAKTAYGVVWKLIEVYNIIVIKNLYLKSKN